LQLKEFSTDFVFQPAALGALASSSCLTQIQLSRVPPQRFTAELCAALGSLRCLRKLHCWLHGHVQSASKSFPPEFVTAVAGLTQLEELTAHGFVPVTSLAALPASLTHLAIQVCQMKGSKAAAGGRAKLQMGHLTKLQSLDLLSLSAISAQSQLPAHVTALKLLAKCGAVHCLPELQWLQLPQVCIALPMLQTAVQQPKLQDLELGLQCASQQQLQKVADALGRCTQLAELHLYPKYGDSLATPIFESGPEHSIDLGEVRLQLQGLRQLQRLRLTQIKWDLKGFSQLTVLNSLTQLAMDDCDIADAGLAVAFQRLTGLRQLNMGGCLPDNECLLVAMACLTNLESLSLIQQKHTFTDATLPLLSPLTKLTYLTLRRPDPDEPDGKEDPLSAEVEEEFLAGMPSLRCIDWLSRCYLCILGWLYQVEERTALCSCTPPADRPCVVGTVFEGVELECYGGGLCGAIVHVAAGCCCSPGVTHCKCQCRTCI
jgi:hypothetical protein